MAGGGNFVDTADAYSEWMTGNSGGESETIIGKWLHETGNRDQMVIATKVAKYSKRPGLSASNIKAAVEDSLRRLQTDYIDLYYAHEDDRETPLEETLGAINELVEAGKVRYIAASQYTGARLIEALELSRTNGFAPYVALQVEYNIMARKDFESGAEPALAATGTSAIPFFGLARGFLSGKYRPGVEVDSVRAGGVKDFQNDRGWKVLAALDEIAQAHSAPVAAISLAWLRARKTVSVPIASARTLEQLQEIMQVVSLSSEEVALINSASNR